MNGFEQRKKRGKKRKCFFNTIILLSTQKRTPPLKRRNTKKHIIIDTSQSRDRSLARSPVKRVDTAEQKAERENEREREREKKRRRRDGFREPWRFQSGRFPLKKKCGSDSTCKRFFPSLRADQRRRFRYGFALLRSSKAVEAGVAMALLCVSVVVVLVAVAGVKDSLQRRRKGRAGRKKGRRRRARKVKSTTREAVAIGGMRKEGKRRLKTKGTQEIVCTER